MEPGRNSYYLRRRVFIANVEVSLRFAFHTSQRRPFQSHYSLFLCASIDGDDSLSLDKPLSTPQRRTVELHLETRGRSTCILGPWIPRSLIGLRDLPDLHVGKLLAASLLQALRRRTSIPPTCGICFPIWPEDKDAHQDPEIASPTRGRPPQAPLLGGSRASFYLFGVASC